MALTEADIQPQMTRRRPGQSAITTPRNEKDRVEIEKILMAVKEATENDK